MNNYSSKTSLYPLSVTQPLQLEVFCSTNSFQLHILLRTTWKYVYLMFSFRERLLKCSDRSGLGHVSKSFLPFAGSYLVPFGNFLFCHLEYFTDGHIIGMVVALYYIRNNPMHS